MSESKEELNNLHFATGFQLDNFGHLHGVYRIVETDAEYRLRVIEKLKEINNDWKENHE